MLTLHGVTYSHPNRDTLFSDLSLSINKYDKIALIGNNGTGKSVLLKILAGELEPSGGVVKRDEPAYYVPQVFGQFNDQTMAQALNVEKKLHALSEILSGNVTNENMTVLDNDWAIEERCEEALSHWELAGLPLCEKMETLSGGQKTRGFLAGILIHRPELVLLDEPSNHLDQEGRALLYEYIQSTRDTLVVVSHDRALLNLLDPVVELSSRGLRTYGGNYEFYAEQKMIENQTLNQEVKNKEKALRKARETERASLERQQKLDARGKKKQEKAGLPKIVMNTLRNNAERSTARLNEVHAEKVGGISRDLRELRNELPLADKMKLDLENAMLHKGKQLVSGKALNISCNGQSLWPESLDLEIRSGERIAIRGANGSGKTSLIRLILGEMQPGNGTINRTLFKALYVDQDYSLIDNRRTVYEQAQQYNGGHLQEHELKIRLNRFLFTKEDWDKPCKGLSGGERMRLMLCFLTISNQAPDLIILDEPTNNLDIQNIEILTTAINEYKGTLLVVSHDEYFLDEVHIERSIRLGGKEPDKEPGKEPGKD